MKKLLLVSVFLIPFTNLIIFASFTYSDSLFLVMFVVLLVSNRFQFHKRASLYFFLLFLFLASNVIATLFAVNHVEAIMRLVQYFYIFFIILPVFLILLKDEKDIKSILYTFYFSGICISLYTLVMFIFSPDVVSTVQGRVYSIYENPWIFSLLLIILLPLGIYFYNQSRNLKKVMNLLFLALIIYMLVLAGARSSFVALAVILILNIVKKSGTYTKNIYMKCLLYISSLLVILLCLFKYKFFLSKIIFIMSFLSPVTGLKLTSLMEGNIDPARTNIYMNGIESISNNFLFGIGPGNFSDLNGISMHNIFFSIWIESGLLALVSVIIIYFITMKELYLKRKVRKELIKVVVYLNLYHLIFMQLNPLLTARMFWFPMIIGIIMANTQREGEDI